MKKLISKLQFLLILFAFCMCTPTSPRSLAQLMAHVEEIKAGTADDHIIRCGVLEIVYAVILGAIVVELANPEDGYEARRIEGGFTNENGDALTTGQLIEEQVVLIAWINELKIEWDLAYFYTELVHGRAAVYVALYQQ